MKQCHVLGLVKLELRSLIKAITLFKMYTMHCQKEGIILAAVRTYHFLK